MVKNLEDRFREEVRRRERQQRKQARRKLRTPLSIVGAAIGLLYLIDRCGSSPSTDRVQKAMDWGTIATANIPPIAIALPQSGVLKQYRSTSSNKNGYIRFFVRAPLKSDRTSLSKTCYGDGNLGDTNNSIHYFVQLVDWQSSKIVTTALIRSGDMVKIAVPFGTYKLV